MLVNHVMNSQITYKNYVIMDQSHMSDNTEKVSVYAKGESAKSKCPVYITVNPIWWRRTDYYGNVRNTCA